MYGRPAKNCSFVFDFLPREGIQLLRELFDSLTSVRFHDADHHVFSPDFSPRLSKGFCFEVEKGRHLRHNCVVET